jgi:hypothetical protein
MTKKQKKQENDLSGEKLTFLSNQRSPVEKKYSIEKVKK